MSKFQTVLILIDTEYIGGPGKGVLQLASFLNNTGHKAIVVTFEYDTPRSTEFVDALRHREIPHLSLNQRFPFDPAALARLRQYISENQITILQTHGYKGHALALPVSRRCSLPWLALTHGWTKEKWRLVLYNTLERFLLRFADYAATVSPQLLEELKRVRKGRACELIENAVELKSAADEASTSIHERFNIKKGKRIALTIGRLSPEKGHSLLIQGWKRFSGQAHDWHLLVVGDGNEKAALKSQVRELDLLDSITFAGYQSQPDAFYDCADIFILPSLSEGLPNVLLECLAAKIPFAGTRVGTIPEIIEDGRSGMLFAPNDINEIEKVLLRFNVLTLDERNDMVSAGFNLLHPRFSVEGRGSKFLRIYKSLTSTPK
jgi:glycosyltransferase involved in cell wall biosynthesis